jgi:hypothetical protein
MSKLHNFLIVTWMNQDYLSREEMAACRQLNFTSLSLPYLPRIGDTLNLSRRLNKKTESGEIREGFIYRVIAVIFNEAAEPDNEWELHLMPVSGF